MIEASFNKPMHSFSREGKELGDARGDGNAFEIRKEGVTLGLPAIFSSDDETAKLSAGTRSIETF